MRPWSFYLVDMLRVVDGDTFDLRLDLGFHQTGAYRFRLRGIDTPEIYRPKDDDELRAGREAKALVEAWFDAHIRNEHPIRIDSFKADSFGRWLADVWVCDPATGAWSSLAAMLREKGYDWSDR